MTEAYPSRFIHGEIEVKAPIQEVWEAWTTPEGIRSFFAPDCFVESRVDGLYEIYFDLDEPLGRRGSESMRILTMQPPNVLAFTWNAPPEFARLRNQRTHVVIYLQEMPQHKTRLTLIQDGWGIGDDWDKLFDYFSKAWLKTVLPRLQYRFEYGPLDWNDRPKFE